MSDFQSYRTLITQYSTLVPPQIEGLVVVWLHEKIAQEEIDKNFTYSDIERAIQEVTVSLALEKKPRTEKILTPLLHQFIENLSDSYERYTLTEYAKKFVRLIQDKLNSPHKYFPLRQSFEKYAQFKAESVHTIEDFESWFRQGFDNTTRQTILDHLESLQDNVRSARNELNRILSSESEQSALQMAHEFTKTFNVLGEKADEIRDTLTLDFGLKQEIKNIVDMFHARLETSYLAGRDAESSSPIDLEEAYQKASDIQKQVNTFFTAVKEKLEHIRRQIIFASGKLNELQEHFRYQSRFKVNLRKMLILLLEEGQYAKEDLTLPSAFPLKRIPYEEVKFVAVSHYDAFSKAPNTVIALSQDDDRRQRDKLEMETVLRNQEKVAEWVEHYQNHLQHENLLDFREHFYKIFEVEENVDIALQVGFELFQFANRETGYVIEVSKPLAEQLKKQEIITWDMKIHRTK